MGLDAAVQGVVEHRRLADDRGSTGGHEATADEALLGWDTEQDAQAGDVSGKGGPGRIYRDIHTFSVDLVWRVAMNGGRIALHRYKAAALNSTHVTGNTK